MCGMKATERLQWRIQIHAHIIAFISGKGLMLASSADTYFLVYTYRLIKIRMHSKQLEVVSTQLATLGYF